MNKVYFAIFEMTNYCLTNNSKIFPWSGSPQNRGTLDTGPLGSAGAQILNLVSKNST